MVDTGNEVDAATAAWWVEHMRRGDFQGAWTLSDALLALRAGTHGWHLPRHVQWVWDGTPLRGKRVLIRCYHGLGDTIQYIRYAPLVREIARDVAVWAQPELLPLLRTVRGIDRLLPLHDGEVEADFDVDVECGELPHVFRSLPETLPAEVPYLHVPPAALPRDGSLRVGLVWRAGDWDARRSIPLPQLAPLFDVSGVTMHVLQRGAGLREWDGRGVPSGSDDVVRTAAVMRALDLVISVDSMPAHLAGALGVPVWVPLHAEPDWRWMLHREDSPWYPTMRLFRQAAAGDWALVVRRLARALEALAAGREGERRSA